MSIFLFEKNESRTPSSSRPRIKRSFLTKREVQIAEYWPSSFFFFFFCVFIYGTITTVLISHLPLEDKVKNLTRDKIISY